MNYPIISPDSITWSKEALEKIEATKTEPCNMIAELVITMDAAKEAVVEIEDLELPYLWKAYPDEFLNSDHFINNPANQRKVINHVLSKYIGWK